DSVDDSYDVERVNSNSDKIDKWAGEVNTSLNQITNKKADLSSPNFSGIPTINNKSIATTEISTLTLLNGWSAYDMTPRMIVSGKNVTIIIRMRYGTVTKGTLITQTNLTPTSSGAFYTCFSVGGQILGAVRIQSNGDITISSMADLTSNSDVNICLTFSI
ncbi:hypothetical protein ACQPUR_16995, partial [Clostridium neonatale]|uniref:hypothetical protein n=1 Tax=Clostridium neonatale TaxID=137838 RepID=UPI003D3422DD